MKQKDIFFSGIPLLFSIIQWKVKWKLLSHVRLCDPMDHRILQDRNLECVAFPSPGDLPNLEIKPRSPTLHVDSLPAKPQGKPKNTGVGSLSLLQRLFLTQESNQGLLHCRWILYQLSYEGSLACYDPKDVGNLISVLLPFVNPVWWSASSRFQNCWSLAWRILSITLLACDMSATVR